MVLILVTVTVGLTGCLHGDGSVSDGEPTGDELVQEMGDRFKDVKSYTFEISQNIETTVQGGGEVRERSSTVDHIGRLNIVNGEVKNSTVSGEDNIWSGRVLNSPGEVAETEGYLTEETQYVRVSDGKTTEWVIIDDPEFIEEQRETSDRVGVVSRISSNSTVEYEGREEVENTETYRVRVEPGENADYFDEILEGGSLVDYNREEVNITLWLDTETYLPVRIDENVLITSEGTGQEGDITTTRLDVDSTLTVSEYSEEYVEIEVPQEAIEATE